MGRSLRVTEQHEVPAEHADLARAVVEVGTALGHVPQVRKQHGCLSGRWSGARVKSPGGLPNATLSPPYQGLLAGGSGAMRKSTEVRRDRHPGAGPAGGRWAWWYSASNRAVPAPDAVAALVSDARVTVLRRSLARLPSRRQAAHRRRHPLSRRALATSAATRRSRRVAEQGYLVVNVSMPMDFAVLAAQPAPRP